MTGGSWVRIPLYPTLRGFGKVIHLQLPVALRRVNSDTVSIVVVGSASERLVLSGVVVSIERYRPSYIFLMLLVFIWIMFNTFM